MSTKTKKLFTDPDAIQVIFQKNMSTSPNNFTNFQTEILFAMEEYANHILKKELAAKNEEIENLKDYLRLEKLDHHQAVSAYNTLKKLLKHVNLKTQEELK